MSTVLPEPEMLRRRVPVRRRRLALMVAVSWAAMAVGTMAQVPVSGGPGGGGPVVPVATHAFDLVAPAMPPAIVAAMQEGRYADAVKALEAPLSDEETPDDASYRQLVTGVAQKLAGQLDAARGTLQKALDASPGGRWTAKLRSELAAVEVASRNFEAAEALARAEASSLVDPNRKDALAGIYRSFAESLLKPDNPIMPADPEGAYALLNEARELAKGPALRASLLLAMARASQAAGNPGRAIENDQAYLDQHVRSPKDAPAADVAAARLGLGEAQLAAGQPEAARRTWDDLVRSMVDEPEATASRAQAMYLISRTYAIPAPGDPNAMRLGVASLRRFLEAYPTHPKAVRAAYEIGQSFEAQGMTDEALAAYRTFLKSAPQPEESAEARRDRAELTMAAAFRVAALLQQQGAFEPAIAAYQEYLAKFPNGPQSAEAQRAILDTKLAIAEDLERHGRHADARAAWEEFVVQNPLDGRVPEALYRVGLSWTKEKPPKLDEAIGAWTTLAGKFPGSEPAGHAQFDIARLFEEEKGDPETAIARYKEVNGGPWQEQAQQRIAAMEAKRLEVVTPRPFRSGETAQLKVTTRNLETLTFTAYKLSPEAYFRKKHTLEGVENLDIGLVAPDAEWTEKVPGYARYKPITTDFALKVPVPGVYVVKVTDEKFLQATTLVVGSDLDAIVKTSTRQILVLAQDMKLGKPRAGARVLVSDGSKVILDAKTGADGVLLVDWPDAPRAGMVHYLLLDGADACGSGLETPNQIVAGLSPRAYLYTDRPAYRPGQPVEVRGLVREVENGQYAVTPGASYRLEVIDARGRPFVTRVVTLSEFGTFHESVELDQAASLGSYRIRLYQPGRSEFGGAFEVQAYQLQKIDLAFDLPRTVYFRGETIEGHVAAKYQYGTPVADRHIVVNLPDGRVLDGKTGSDGRFAFSVSTEAFGESQILAIAAQLPEDGVAAGANVALAVEGFQITTHLVRDRVLAGEPFALDITATDALGKPAAQKLSVAVIKRVDSAEAGSGEREVARHDVTTDAETGKATLKLEIDDEEGGVYVLRVAGTDQFHNPILHDQALQVSGSKDENRLNFLADRVRYKVGETATVRLHSRMPAGLALLCWEADRILTYKVVGLKEGDNPITWPVDGAQFPNFTLTAAQMADTRFQEARVDLDVERELRVVVKPVKDSVAPGEEVAVDVTVTDQLGKPVKAEIGLALVDRALLRRFADAMPPVGPFFYDQHRQGAFATEATNTFEYRPTSVPVPSAIVEDQARQAASLADRKALDKVKEMADGSVAMSAPAAPAPVAADAEMNAFAKSELGQAAAKRSSMGRMAGGPGGRPGAYYSMSGRAGGMGGGMGGMGMAGEPAESASRDRREQLFGFDTAAGTRLSLGDAIGPRQVFVETAYWNPSIVTDDQGQAHVVFPAPTALSSYEFTARGITGADTLVGQAQASLSVSQDFFVELKTPAILTEGDKPRFRATVHHRGITGKVELTLQTYVEGAGETTYPKTIEINGDGQTTVDFDAINIPDTRELKLTLKGKATNAEDTVESVVPVRPYGIQAFASASGSSSDDTAAILTLPPGREYQSPSLLISLSPTTRRMLVELALGDTIRPLDVRERVCFPIPPSTTLDRAGDLLAAAAVLRSLQGPAAAGAAPEAARLADRVRSIAAELITLQNDDGSWPLTRPSAGQALPGDRLTSARATWALAAAEAVSLLSDPGALDRAVAYLEPQFNQADAADSDTRAALLHALSTRRKASFEAANALSRGRTSLSDVALAYLALTFANLDRKELAQEVLGVLSPRVKRETVAPGTPDRLYWEGSSRNPAHRGAVEATALAALAYAQASPASPELKGASAWLLAHRTGLGWTPARAKGPILAALATSERPGPGADDHYRLVVTVNDQEIYRGEINGAAEGLVLSAPEKILAAGGPNRVRFDIEGRGTFGYAATLTAFTREFGPDQEVGDRSFVVTQSIFMPAEPTFDGKTLPTGFGSTIGATYFENWAHQVELGGRVRVRIDAQRRLRAGLQPWEREFLVLESHLPAGTTLVEGSVQSAASRYEVGDGVITFFFAPDQDPWQTYYDVHGYLPGEYRIVPPQIWSAYEPGQRHMPKAGVYDLKVLSPGEQKTDEYKPTPDELYARGKALFDAGKLADAAKPLEALWEGWTLNNDVAKDAARMLLWIHLEHYDARKVVQYFEVLKERHPELVIPFDKILIIGRAYRDIGEFERAYLVWNGLVEASYLEDARLGELLRQRGKPLEAVALLLDLWRQYPNSASIESDFFGLSQLVAAQATSSLTDPTIRQALATAGKSRSDLILQSIQLVQVFLTLSPRNPIADEASLALVGSFLDLEDYPSVVKLCERFAKLYPKSSFLDSFQYSEALGRFHLGEYDRAIEIAQAIANATYKDAAGVDQPSPNKWQALYIIGQIHDARRQAAEAIDFYKKVADQFTDAAEAVRQITRKELSLPEVTVLRPGGEKVAQGGLRSIPPEQTRDPAKPEAVVLSHRNIKEADVKVYPVDLMRLYLTRRSLDGIAGIDLAGITPLHEMKIDLGAAIDLDVKTLALKLPLTKEGAYLVMVRGDDQYASGIALVTPLEMDVLEESQNGRVRVNVRNAETGAPAPKVQVKVTGTNNPSFFTGDTDLRGVFLAEGVQGQVTAVAKLDDPEHKDAPRYAFHRGTTFVGAPPTPAATEAPAANAPADQPAQQGQSLEQNVQLLNRSNQMRQLERLQERYQAPNEGGAQLKGFK
jgi:uncharacterized protein YfaS (alpha-2-macroglobulin family)/tetratricopeptide (TPR) repeat protein